MNNGSFLSLERDEISISMLGSFALRKNQKFLALGVQGLTRELLYYLFAKPNQLHRREHLMDIFWPDSTPTRTRSALSTGIWRLKQRAASLPGIDILSVDHNICLSVEENVKVDCHILEASMENARSEVRDTQALSQSTRNALSKNLKSSRGIFLEGCEAYWALIDREYYQNLSLRGLYYLMRDAIDRHLFDRAISWGLRLVEGDPWRESVYYDLIYLYLLTDQRVKALQLYDQLEKTLHDELNLTPNIETKALKLHILSESAPLNLKRNTISPAPSPIFMPEFIST